jgi:hypothetical protein
MWENRPLHEMGASIVVRETEREGTKIFYNCVGERERVKEKTLDDCDNLD